MDDSPIRMRPLTSLALRQATDEAKELIRHDLTKPEESEFEYVSASSYPVWLIWGVLILLAIVILAGANISIIRVYKAGYDRHISIGASPEWQAQLIGISTFILAEFMVIVSTIAYGTLFKGPSKRVMLIPIFLGLLMSILGNWVVADPDFTSLTAMSYWEITDTLVPPVSLMFMAIILERVITQSIKERFDKLRVFDQAMKEYLRINNMPESHPDYRIKLANSVRRSLTKSNSRGNNSEARIEYMENLEPWEWSDLVMREIEPEHWLNQDPPTEVKVSAKVSESLQPLITADFIVKNHPLLVSKIVASIDVGEDIQAYRSYLEVVKDLLPDKVSSRRLIYLEKKSQVIMDKLSLKSTVSFSVVDGQLRQHSDGEIPEALLFTD